MSALTELPLAPLSVTLPAFADWLAGRRQERRIPAGPWSLAELRLSEQEYEWCVGWTGGLRRWEVEPESRRVIPCMGPTHARISPAVALGGLLFLTEAEHARRHATEGTLWPAMKSLPFQDDFRSVLFHVGIGQPTRLHKDLIEDAARGLGLRHVFGVEGLQEWFSSFYLQFGFTRRGSVSGLAHWLSGYNQPQAVSQLSNSGGRLACDTFIRTWYALYAFRRNNATERQVKDDLTRSPWTLPEWADDLLTAARKHAELLDRDAAELDESDSETAFLQDPKLVWAGPQPPQISLQIGNFADLDLSAESYAMRSSRHDTLAQAIRQPSGFYTLLPEGPIMVPISTSALEVQFVTKNGDCHASQRIMLFDTDEDVMLFRDSSKDGGELIEDAYNPRLQIGQAFCLVTAPDLTVQGPEPAAQFEGPMRHFRFYPQGWSEGITVILEDEPLWSSDCLMHRPPQIECGAVSCEWLPENDRDLASPGRIEIRLRNEVALKGARIAGESLRLTPQGADRYRSDLLLVSRSNFDAEIVITLALRVGGRAARLRVKVQRGGVGLIRHTRTGSEYFPPEKLITVRTASSDRFTVVLPVQDNALRASIYRGRALCEGSAFHGRPSMRKKLLPRLHGYGAPLEVCDRPFNSDGQANVLARSVIDGGVVRRGIIDPAASRLTLELSAPIDPTQEHWILLWSNAVDFKFLPATVVPNKPNCWMIENLCLSQFHAAILGFRNQCLGCYWDRSWSSQLTTRIETEAEVVARCIRVFKLPILDSFLSAQLRGLVATHWLRLVSAWLQEEKWTIAGREIEMPKPDDGWFSVLNTAFFRFSLNVSATDAEVVLAQVLGETGDLRPREVVTRAAIALVDISPWLMAAVVRSWTIAYAGGEASATLNDARKALLAPLEYDRAIEECARVMGVDDNFVRTGLLDRVGKAHLPPLDRQNLQRAVQQRPFRRLAGAQLLSLP